MMMDIQDNTPIAALTVGQFKELFINSSKDDKKEMRTHELCVFLDRDSSTISLMGRAGMYEARYNHKKQEWTNDINDVDSEPCYIGKNKWNGHLCKLWMNTVYKEVLAANRKRQMLVTKRRQIK